MAKLVKEKNPGKSYAEIRAGLNASVQTAVGLFMEEIDENFDEINTNTQEIQQAKQSVTDLADRFELLDANRLAAYPENPNELPEPAGLQEVRATAEGKADTIITAFDVLTPINNVYTLDFNAKQPRYRINQIANATIQIDSMSGLDDDEVLLYVKKITGTVSLTFRDKTTPIEPYQIGTLRTENGTLDEYSIKKIDDRFYILRTSLGPGVAAAAPAPETLDYVHNFTLTQGQDPDGKLYVKVDFNQHPLAVSYKLICSKNSNTATSPTVFDPTFEYRGNGYKHYGKTSAETNGVIQEGVTYHYGLRLSLPNYDTVWVRGSITIE